MNRLHTASTAALRHWVVRLVVASLLLVQSLGVLHNVAHRAGQPARVGESVSATSAHGYAVASLFAGHQSGDAECRLFDQLSHGDLASLPALAIQADFSPALAHAKAPAGHLPAPTRSYSARGPPALA
jgi:predicted ABC-type transport system involved in lysophospholipase L1 biosynthesis ATPase subunit